jgi:hypothetical protein
MLKLKVAVEKSTATFIWWEIFPAARYNTYSGSGVQLGLHLDCSGEQNVILQESMLVQILFEVSERIVKSLVTNADALRHRVV